MKKTLLTLVACAAFAGAAVAGFVSDKNQNLTVNAAKELRDDTPVQLKGRITQSLGDEKYIFADDTGTIIVEIDNEDWRGQDVSPKDTVIIDGEMDKSFFSPTEIDVDRIEIVQ